MLICVLWVLKSCFILVLQCSMKALGGVGHIILMNIVYSWTGFTQLSSVGSDRTSNFRIMEWLSGGAEGDVSQPFCSLELAAQDHVPMIPKGGEWVECDPGLAVPHFCWGSPPGWCPWAAGSVVPLWGICYCGSGAARGLCMAPGAAPCHARAWPVWPLPRCPVPWHWVLLYRAAAQSRFRAARRPCGLL